MIPKPEILKGEVKELNVLLAEWIDISISVYRFEINQVNTFYSQPFKPEIITEYFKGWEMGIDKEGDLYVTDNYEEFSFYNDSDTSIRYMRMKYLEMPNVIPEQLIEMPKTLSQFITNCIQSNIKLEWK